MPDVTALRAQDTRLLKAARYHNLLCHSNLLDTIGEWKPAESAGLMAIFAATKKTLRSWPNSTAGVPSWGQ